MDAAYTSETRVIFYQIHDATLQETVIFIFTAMNTSNLTRFQFE
jgi:hypothetical protein